MQQLLLQGYFQQYVSSDRLLGSDQVVNMEICGVDRLPWQATRRTLILGLIIGSSLKLLSWGKEQLEVRADVLSENIVDDTSKRG